MRRVVWAALLVVLTAPQAAFPQADAEKLRAAKALFFDREYALSREAWQVVRAAGGSEAKTALYWIARCSESLGESERALDEYARFLAARPADRTLVGEAKTSRVALAVKLAKRGRTGHLALAREALSDESRTVRYFAALQMASLGPEAGRAAVPVLKEILANEKDDDLVERAKLALLRVDKDALAEATPLQQRAGKARQTRWIRVRIYEKGKSSPHVSINLPVALAELVFKSLPDDTLADLRREGYDANKFWERLKQTGPTEILTIEGEDGGRVQVWIE
jgi:hypothetical protein